MTKKTCFLIILGIISILCFAYFCGYSDSSLDNIKSSLKNKDNSYSKMKVVSVSENHGLVVREVCINKHNYLIFNGSSTFVLESNDSSIICQ